MGRGEGGVGWEGSKSVTSKGDGSKDCLPVRLQATQIIELYAAAVI